MFAPQNTTAPADGREAPASKFRRLVLPAPFGPTTPTASSPLSMKSTLSTAKTALKRLAIPAATRVPIFSSIAAEPSYSKNLTQGQELSTHGNLWIVCILGDDHIKLVLASRLRFYPLRPDNAARRNVRER